MKPNEIKDELDKIGLALEKSRRMHILLLEDMFGLDINAERNRVAINYNYEACVQYQEIAFDYLIQAQQTATSLKSEVEAK